MSALVLCRWTGASQRSGPGDPNHGPAQTEHFPNDQRSRQHGNDQNRPVDRGLSKEEFAQPSACV